MTKHALGIDLGTTFLEVAIVFKTGPQIINDKKGKPEIPSIVNIVQKNGDLMTSVGNFALPRLATQPKNTIFDTKRMLAKSFNDENIQKLKKVWPFDIEESDTGGILICLKDVDKKYKPYEISGELLKFALKVGNEFLPEEEKTTDAIITVPANFGDQQRTETIEAAKNAGINILSIVNEPTAAGFAHISIREIQKESNILVFDFGGGTLDVSIIYVNEDEITVKATDGDMFLGGRDFDENTLQYLVNKFDLNDDFTKNLKKMKKLREKVIDAKIELSNSLTSTIDEDEDGVFDEYELTLEEFETINQDLISKILVPVEKVLSSAGLNKNEIDSIILSGGSSNMKFVDRKLTEFFGKKPFNGINPTEAVAIGASQLAAKIIRDYEIPPWIKSIELNEICPFSIGTSNDINGQMEVLIEKDTRIPTFKSITCQTIYYRQEEFIVNVLEGDSFYAKDNNLLGHFSIPNLPSTEFSLSFDITFSIDKNGILSASAKLNGGDLGGSINDIDIFKNRSSNKNNFVSDRSNEKLNEFIVFFTNIQRFLNLNRNSLISFYKTSSLIDSSFNEADNYLKDAENFYDNPIFIGLENYAGGFCEKFKKYFKNNQTPFFLKI